jgi:hypothetical protein
MTREQLAAQLREAIDSYEYPQVEGTVGTLWTPDRVAGEIALLRQSIVEPSQRVLHIYEKPDEVFGSSPRSERLRSISTNLAASSVSAASGQTARSETGVSMEISSARSWPDRRLPYER